MACRVGRSVAAGVAALALISNMNAAFAQTSAAPAPAPVPAPPVEPLPVDPSEPLAPLPEIGVDWPDMNAPDDPGPLPGEEAEAEAEAVEGVAGVTAELPPAPAPTLDGSVTSLRYGYRLEGVEAIEPPEGIVNADFRTRFAALSSLAKGDGEPANAAQLDRRAGEDAELLAALLRAYGYYDATVATTIENTAERNRLTVVLTAAPGPLYRYSGVDLPGLDAAGERAAPLRQAFGVDAGEPVLADQVIAGETALKLELGNLGFPFAKVGAHDILVDHASDQAALSLPVDPGGLRRFGNIRVQGSPPFSPRHVGIISRFERGEVYNQALVDDLRKALIATGLISTVNIEPIATADPELVDVAVTLAPAPFRTLAGEAGYGTGEGFRVEGSWTHRNFFNPEGAVTFRGILGTQEQLLSASLRRNNFIKRDRILTAIVAASNTDREAYDARTFTLAAALERQTNIIWQKKWTWSVGAELLASDERDVLAGTGQRRRRTFFIGALPGSLGYDGSDDLLNPTRGFRLGGRISPEASFQGSAFGYVRTQLDGSYYRPVSEQVVLAGRARLGTIVGATRDRIAPSRRYYAGGGGSVRGYGYQRIGPLDVNDDPIGGRGLAEFSLESRIRLPFFGGNFGVVPFVDAGAVSTSLYPKLEDLSIGAGVGIRYYTAFGPIRIDVGTPLNPRPGDPRIAVYVSLGQAF